MGFSVAVSQDLLFYTQFIASFTVDRVFNTFLATKLPPQFHIDLAPIARAGTRHFKDHSGTVVDLVVCGVASVFKPRERLLPSLHFHVLSNIQHA